MVRKAMTALAGAVWALASVALAQTDMAPRTNATFTDPLAPPAALLFRSEWTVTPHQHPVTQADLMNQTLELKLYGPSGKEIVTASQGAPSMAGAAPTHVFTGLCEQNCAAALRDRKNYMDLSGLAKIRWNAKVSGTHRVRLIVKLADGTWYLSDHEDSNSFDFHPSEFTVSEAHWIKLDIDRVVSRGDWLERSAVDLRKVDEIGFTSLMPGGGHGDGGYIDMGWIEVYGKAVPR